MNKYKIKKISQKTPLYTILMPETKTATILFMFKTGSRYENRKNSGISHFLEHMFFKGTKNRPDTATISGELDSLGSEFNAFTSKEYTGYYVKVSSLKFKSAFKILGDMLLNSIFSEEEIEREKGVIIEELNMYEDNPLMHVEDVFESCLYGDTPAGWDTIGTKETIKSFKREDFINYFESQYGLNSLSLVLAGKFSDSDIKLAESILLKFKNNSWKNKEKVLENQKKPAIKAVYKNVDQVALSLGVRTFPSGHPLEIKTKLLSIILGGAMSSRLFIKLRERSGLAYYVKTLTEFHSDSGYLTTQAGVPIDKVSEAISIILQEYKNLGEDLVSEEELKKAKDIFRGRLALRLEASDDVANWYGHQAIFKEKLTSPKEFLAEIDKIKAVDLKRLASKIFVNEALNLALIGKVKEDNFRKILKF